MTATTTAPKTNAVPMNKADFDAARARLTARVHEKVVEMFPEQDGLLRVSYLWSDVGIARFRATWWKGAIGCSEPVKSRFFHAYEKDGEFKVKDVTLPPRPSSDHAVLLSKCRSGTSSSMTTTSTPPWTLPGRSNASPT